jgi:hypothetical protein
MRAWYMQQRNAIKRERKREGETEARTNEIDGGSGRRRVTRAVEWLKRSERDPGTVTLAASGTYFCCGGGHDYALIRRKVIRGWEWFESMALVLILRCSYRCSTLRILYVILRSTVLHIVAYDTQDGD